MSLSLKTQARIKKELGWTDDDFKKTSPAKAETARPVTNKIDLSGMTGTSRRTRDDAGVRNAYAKREDALTGGAMGDAVRRINTLAVNGIDSNTDAHRYNSALEELQKILETDAPSGGMTFREDGTVAQNSSPSALERVGMGLQSIGKTLWHSPGVIYDTANQMKSDIISTDTDPRVAELRRENETLTNQLTAIRQGYGNAAWGTEDEIRAKINANTAQINALRTSNPVSLDTKSMQGMGEAISLAQQATQGMNGWAKDFADAGISIGQNLASMPLALINPKFALGALGGQSAAQRMYELSAQGVGAEEALGRGLLSGGIEMLTEKLPLDNLVDMVGKGNLRNFAINILKQAGLEGTEEVVSYVLNYAADKLANDPMAEFSVEELMQIAKLGAISGGFFGIGGTAVGGALNRISQNAQQQTPNVYSPETQALVQDIAERLRNAETAQMPAKAQETAPISTPENAPAPARQTAPTVPQNVVEAQKTGSSVPSEVLAADLAAMQKIGDVFGENGGSFIWQMYMNRKGETGAAELYQSYLPYYEAGVNGRDMNTVNVRDNILDETEMTVAYQAGVLDAQKSLAQEQAQVGNVPAANAPKTEVDFADRPAREIASQRENLATLPTTPTINETPVGMKKTAQGEPVRQTVRVDADTENTLNRIAQRGGAQIEIVESIADGSAAKYMNGRITVSAAKLSEDRAGTLRSAVMHELTHHIETSGQYDRLKNTVLKYARQHGDDVQSGMAAIEQEYRARGETLGQDGAEREYIAKYIEEHLATEEAVQYLAHEDRTLFERIREFLRGIVQQFTGTQDEREMRKLLAIYDKALDTVGTNEANRYSGEQHLIETLPDGRQYVKATRPVIRGEDPSAWSKQAEEFINESIRSGNDVRFYTKDGFAVDVTERSAYKLTDVHVQSVKKTNRAQLSDQEIASKMRAVGHIDELIETARWKEWKPDRFKKHDNDIGEDGFDYFETYFEDSDGQYYLVGFSAGVNNTADGRDQDTAYSVGEMRKRSHPSGSGSSSSPTGSGAQTRVTSNKSISENGKKNNGNNNQNSGQSSYGSSLKAINERLSAMSEEERAELVRENERQRRKIEQLKGQMKRTPKGKKSETAVRKAAKQFLSDYDSTADITERLQALYDKIGADKQSTTYQEVYLDAMEIAMDVVTNSETLNDDLAQQYKDMTDYLRKTKVTISEADRSDLPDDYQAFRRKHMGRLNIGNDGVPVDVMYDQLADDYGDTLFPDEITHPAAQLERIAEVLDAFRPVYENRYQSNLGEAAHYLALDIIGQGVNTEAAKTTYADRQAEKLAEAKGETRAAQNALRDAAKQYDRDTRALESERDRVLKALEKEKARREKDSKELRETFRERNRKQRERTDERTLRRKIERHAAKLNQRLLSPTDKKNVPDDLRNAMTAALDAINLSSKNHKMTGRTQAFIKLRREYAAILNGKEDFDLALDPDLFGRGAAQGLFDRVLDMGDTPIAELKMDDLQTIWKVVRSLEHAVSTAGKMLAQKKFARTIEWARAIERDTATFKSKKTTAASHRVLDHETPYTYFNHFGAAGHEIYRMLRNAQDEQQMKLDSIRDTVSKIADEKAVRKLQKDTHTFDVNGEKLTLTTAHVMELYLLNKRGQARDHLMGGGIMQPEIKSAKIESGSQAVLLDPIQLGKILSVLTDEQKQMADKLQKLTTTTLAEWGNDASMKAYGYKKFTGTDYWPIRCAKEEIHTEVENGERNVRSIKNIGMAKAITPGANNALQLRGVFQTFAAHAGDMIDYSTWLCPMEDANRLLNFRFKDEHGVQTGTMKNLIETYSGDKDFRYWTGLMDNIQNGIGRQADAAIVKDLAKATSYVKASSVGANIRVIVQQPTAILRAAAVLDPQHLLGGVVKGKTGWRGWQKAVKYAPIAARKAQGGYEIKNMQSMSEVLYNEKTALGKFSDLTTAGAAKADEITWGRIWNACERQVKAQDKSIDVRTSEFNEKVAELFTEVIDQTQVVDGVLQRSRAMRSSDTLVKMATSFMGEPTQSLNILLRAWDGVRREGDGKKRGQAMKTASRAAFAVLVTDIVNAFAQSLVDSTRDDDEEKKYWERVWAAFTGISGDEKSLIDFAKSIGLKGNLANNLNPINRIYGLKDTMSILQGFTVERMDTSGLADFIKAAADGLAYIGGNGEKTRLYAIRQLLTAGSKLFGIPAANIFRDVISIARSVAIENGDNKALLEMRKMDWRIEDEDNKNKFLGLALKAKQEGDDDVAEEIFDALKDAKIMTELEIRQYEANQFDKNANDLIEAAFEAKKSGDDVALNVLTDMLIGMGYTADKIEDVLDKKTLSELRDSWEYAETKSDAYVKIYDEATASAAYSQLTSEQKESFASRVNTYSRAVADDAHIEDYEEDSKWILRCQSAKKEVGMTESQFLVAYHATSGLESLKDKDGKTITNSLGLLKMQAIYNIPGLNEKQRNYMYDACSIGKSIRAYSRDKVDRELAKMKKLAK